MADDELAFLNLILLLGTMTNTRLDSSAKAVDDARNEILHKARETIDMLASLKKRTQGRLTEQEDRVMATMLADLGARYVKALARRSG